MLFRDDLHEEFGTWPLAYIPYGGAEFGEISAGRQPSGDMDHFTQAVARVRLTRHHLLAQLMAYPAVM